MERERNQRMTRKSKHIKLSSSWQQWSPFAYLNKTGVFKKLKIKDKTTEKEVGWNRDEMKILFADLNTCW